MIDILQTVAVISTSLVCFLVFTQLVIAVGGVLHRRKSLRDQQQSLPPLDAFPELTILIPAHNEEMVIERTVQHMLALHYPEDRLKILVIDDASTDATPEILDQMAAGNPRINVFHRYKPDGGRGKAAALNAAMKLVTSELIAIYDADNCPEPDALLFLVARIMQNSTVVATVGKFRTGNKRKNILTRCINVEGLCFQNIMQAGRNTLTGVSFLTGTNYVIRRDIVDELGGWDEEALAEDSEMSIRLYMQGYRIDYVPYSVSWEQEPETFAVWLKQRTRWARGNNYAIVKLLKNFHHSKAKIHSFENLFMLVTSYCFLFAIGVAQLTVILRWLQVGDFSYTAEWLFYFWKIAYLLYVVQVFFVLYTDREHSPENILVGMVMYLTYSYMWLLAIARALYLDLILREERTWDKTVRFNTEYETVGTQAVVGVSD